MTCGIYKLNFLGTDKVYIGQSINIEKRYKQHLLNIKNKTANSKLLEAHTKYGTPELEVLSECDISDLDSYENECIEIWNSVANGYNLYQFANQSPTYTGYGYGNSKYLKEAIIFAFNLLVSTDLTFSDIEKETSIPLATVANIALLISHYWLKEEYPDKYEILVLKKNNRNNYGAVSDKLSAKAKGIIYPPIRSPEGEVYSIDNAYKFAKLNNLAPNHFQEVLNGHRKSHKGWKLA